MRYVVHVSKHSHASISSVLGPVLLGYDYLQYSNIAKFILPLVNERLGLLEKEEEKLPLYDKKKPVSPPLC